MNTLSLVVMVPFAVSTLSTMPTWPYVGSESCTPAGQLMIEPATGASVVVLYPAAAPERAQS